MHVKIAIRNLRKVWWPPLSTLHVTQIRAALTRLLDGKIDISDLSSKADATKRDDAFATRSLAAFAVALSAGVPPESVAPYVVDGFGDNGLDVIYFEPDDKRLFLAQAKFSKRGDSGVQLGDTLKFLAGVRDIMNMEFSRFTSKRVLALRNMLQQSLEDAATRVTIVLAHTSVEPISRDIQSRVDELLSEVNDASELMAFQHFGQSELHRALSGQAEGAPISAEAMISDWGHVREPYQAYYGQINGAELANWYATYGDRLLSKNIRKALGQTEVNRQIVATGTESPEHFWYFNNGVTVLCQSVKRKPLGGGGKSSAVLECSGMSIVNGAQTVASLAAAAAASPEAVKRASVLIRFISLEACPLDFATAVTRATNVQNRVEYRDFASLDPTQDRLRRELLLEGKTYAYKAGDTAAASDAMCTMEEAAIALACSHQDVALSVTVKAKSGSVWENLDSPKSIYKRLFRDALTGVTLWRQIQLLRSIDDVLRYEQKTRKDNRERMIAVHGNRFVAHEVYRRLDMATTLDAECDLDALKKEAGRIVPMLLPLIAKTVQSEFPTAYLQSLFKNATKCAAVSKVLEISFSRRYGKKALPKAGSLNAANE